MDYYKKYIKYKKKYIDLKVNGGFITNIIPMNNKQIFNRIFQPPLFYNWFNN